MRKKRVAILFSGGLDSTVAMAKADQDEDLALAICVDYGQRHAREIESAQRIADRYEVPLMILDFKAWGHLLKGSAITDASVDIPAGEYEDQSMALTVVPNRNATMLMAAVGIAQSYELDEVWVAVHSGDHPLYADCQPDFIESAKRTAELGTAGAVTIDAPFVHMDKTEIVKIGSRYSAPFQLTWSCYEGGESHCGKCGTCVERISAFSDAGVKDPTIYGRSENESGN